MSNLTLSIHNYLHLFSTDGYVTDTSALKYRSTAIKLLETQHTLTLVHTLAHTPNRKTKFKRATNKRNKKKTQ